MFNLANVITIIRVFFVVPIVALLYFEGPTTCLLAAFLFVLGEEAEHDPLEGPRQAISDPKALTRCLCAFKYVCCLLTS